MGGNPKVDSRDATILALKVRLRRLVEAIVDCEALDMGNCVDIRLDRWELVESEILDCEAILRNP